MNPETEIEAQRVHVEVPAAELEHEAWEKAPSVFITHYWSGEVAPIGRHAEARLIWSDEALCVRFVCRQNEPLVVNRAPLLDRKAIGLWDRDACEIFIAPDALRPERYFEFEAAPTGEWLDLRIHWMPDGRETDWDFQSGMTTAARIAECEITIAMRLPWEGFGMLTPPHAGERWLVNLFRCIGAEEDDASRGYLAWQPTRTARPNFHVPEAFGWFCFKDG